MKKYISLIINKESHHSFLKDQYIYPNFKHQINRYELDCEEPVFYIKSFNDK